MTAPEVACRVCGGPTTNLAQRRRTETPSGTPTPAEDYPLAACDACLLLAPDEPGAAVRAALSRVGLDPAVYPDAADVLLAAGVDVTPVLFDSLAPGLPGRGSRGPQRPFAHLDGDAKRALRAAKAALLRSRVEAVEDDGPGDGTPGLPPHGDGCALCGLAEAEEWFTVTTGALTPGPGYVETFFCPACAEVAQEVGAVGPELIERAVLGYFDRGQWFGLNALPPGTRAWLATGEPAAETRFAWLPEPALPEPEPTMRDIVARLEALEARLR